MYKSLEVLLGYTQRDLATECMLWTRCVNTDGYPRACIEGNCNAKVHRIIYELSNKDVVMQGKVVRHTCDQPKCINPEHLILGTPTENVADRKLRGRSHQHVTVEEYKSVESLRATGLTYKQIAHTLSMQLKRVEYILTKYKT